MLISRPQPCGKFRCYNNPVPKQCQSLSVEATNIFLCMQIKSYKYIKPNTAAGNTGFKTVDTCNVQLIKPKLQNFSTTGIYISENMIYLFCNYLQLLTGSFFSISNICSNTVYVCVWASRIASRGTKISKNDAAGKEKHLTSKDSSDTWNNKGLF